ncbi:hypothetical protein GPECTOR_309g844 [Gonium pectorale]|uniref:Thioesterase domain-containing protein n=1 Tax=Gonium pectorale TaxID=33097 RepID=A0A150FVS0_GONPE|nr:hypothetical protein GPECTOR_309g844 [Gonium pectorale]|eukprot:KXZ41714.1 hypothetical protein GPECTOR_309g844 [Gonium pectorale]
MLAADHIRKINLIEVLAEEAEERCPPGRVVELPPEQEAMAWSEERIRSFFEGQLAKWDGGAESGDSGRQRHESPGADAANSEATQPVSGRYTSATPSPPAEAGISGGGDMAAGAGGGGHAAPSPPPPRSPAPPPPSPELFARWFPGLARSGTAIPHPRLRVLAFHSAGNAEDMYSSEGTGARRSPSPLLEWCRSVGAELLAVQLPGRATRAREPFITTAQGIAASLLPVVGHALGSGVPYVVLSHSFGCWAAFETLRAARAADLPMPAAWCLSAMPYPDLPHDQRPWRPQRGLRDVDFKDEMRGWDINEVVFSDGMWQVYEPLMRADCTVYDEYELKPDEQLAEATAAGAGGGPAHSGPQPRPGRPPVAPFEFPITAFWGATDRRVRAAFVRAATVLPLAAGRIRQEHVALWSRFTTGPFRLHRVDGNHLWPLNNPAAKAAWLAEVVAAFQAAALEGC